MSLRSIAPVLAFACTNSADPPAPQPDGTADGMGDLDGGVDDMGEPDAYDCDETQTVSDDRTLTASTSFCPGTHAIVDIALNGVLIIGADDITIDGGGLTLDGSTGDSMTARTGFGIRIDGRNNVTIRNFDIRGYRYAIHITNSTNITVQDCDLSHNYNDTDVDWDDPPYWQVLGWTPPSRPSSVGFLGEQVGLSFGGGIYMQDVSESTFERIVAQYQAIGFDLQNCHYNEIRDSDGSHNSAWGIYMRSSSHNTIDHNKFNDCWRDYMLDSSSTLLDYDSDENIITNNELRDSADGHFGRWHTTNPNDDNIVSYNDGTGAGANAFEHTNATGNVFEYNVANESNYGFWLGGSSDSYVRNNEVMRNRVAGIAVEFGNNIEISGNDVRENGGGAAGIDIWHNPSSGRTSHSYTITGNTIRNNYRGIRLRTTPDSTIEGNLLDGNIVSIELEGGSTNTTIASNNLLTTRTGNVARSRPTLASAFVSSAPYAADGLVFSENGGWVEGSTISAGHWWQVDLQSTRTISTIALFPYSVNPHDFPNIYRIEASTTGAFTGEQVTVVDEDFRQEVARTLYHFTPASARYVRLISEESRAWARLQELEVYEGEDVDGVIALRNLMSTNVIAENNYWGTTTTSQIDQFIVDDADNTEYGVVDYQPFLSTPVKTK